MSIETVCRCADDLLNYLPLAKTVCCVVQKFSASMSIGGIMSRLQAKYALMRTALGEDATAQSGGQPHQVLKAVEKPRRKRLWRASIEGGFDPGRGRAFFLFASQ